MIRFSFTDTGNFKLTKINNSLDIVIQTKDMKFEPFNFLSEKRRLAIFLHKWQIIFEVFLV